MKVYELLEKPEAWGKGDFAWNAEGRPVGENDPTACTWCLDGAVCRVYTNYQDRLGIKKRIREYLLNKGYGGSIWGYNDSIATHADVVALCKELDI